MDALSIRASVSTTVGGQPGGRGFGIDLTTLVGVLIAHLVGWQYISFHERLHAGFDLRQHPVEHGGRPSCPSEGLDACEDLRPQEKEASCREGRQDRLGGVPLGMIAGHWGLLHYGNKRLDYPDGNKDWITQPE